MPYNSVLYQLFDIHQPSQSGFLCGTKIKIHRHDIESHTDHHRYTMTDSPPPTLLWYWPSKLPYCVLNICVLTFINIHKQIFWVVQSSGVGQCQKVQILLFFLPVFYDTSLFTARTAARLCLTLCRDKSKLSLCTSSLNWAQFWPRLDLHRSILRKHCNRRNPLWHIFSKTAFLQFPQKSFTIFSIENMTTSNQTRSSMDLKPP